MNAMQRQCVIASATIVGVEARLVEVEVVLTTGIPGFSIVGMPDAAIQESRERVRSAIKASGFAMPTDKIVVNLAPGSLKKTGSGFDLPIALGVLAASGQIPVAALNGSLVVGELSLEGSLREVKGMLAFELCARDARLRMVCPHDCTSLIAIEDLEIATAETLAAFRHEDFSSGRPLRRGEAADELDYAQVGGHELAKRALQVAAAGNHGVLMIGPPGSGKTMLASRLPSIMPPLSDREILETAQIYSVVGEDISGIIAGRRPFRNPHHSTSLAGLVGGGSPIRPGEVSLAHNGVLFLDELAEFKPSTLQGIRQPMEGGCISIVRAEGTILFPARFMLVAATNPCPCGYYGDPQIDCSCSLSQIHAYQNRIGGPLLDRIEIQLDVWRSDFDKVVHAGKGSSSKGLKEGVLKARRFAAARKSVLSASSSNRTVGDITDVLHVDAEAEEFMRDAAQSFDMSGRAIISAFRVARTIADLDEDERVRSKHVAEALSYRLREGARA